MDNENTVGKAPESKKKSIYIAVGVIIVVVLAAWGLSKLSKGSETAANPCNIDIRSTIYDYASTSPALSDAAAARAVFDHYFSIYKTMPGCAAVSLSDFKLVSVGASTKRDNGFTIPVTFDLKPISMSETKWGSPEAKVDGEWIRGKKGVLSITRVGDVYQLVI